MTMVGRGKLSPSPPPIREMKGKKKDFFFCFLPTSLIRKPLVDRHEGLKV